MKSSTGPDISRELLAIFLLAVVLGLAYNRTSPLGVAGWTSQAAAPPASAKVDSPVAVPAADLDPALHNDTVVAVIVPAGPEASALPARKLPASMPWPEIKPLLAKGDIVLLDGRDSASYEAGHIPGAISLPLMMLTEKIAQFSAQYPNNKTMVVYCASIRCPASHAEAITLSEQYGYSDVREMPGGFAEWRVAEPSVAPATGATP